MGLGKLVKGVGKLAAKGVGSMIPFRGGGPKIQGVGQMSMSRPGMGTGMSAMPTQAPSPPPNPNLPPQPDIATGGAQMMAQAPSPVAPPMQLGFSAVHDAQGNPVGGAGGGMPQGPPPQGMMRPAVMPQQNQDQMNILQRMLAGNPGGYGGMR